VWLDFVLYVKDRKVITYIPQEYPTIAIRGVMDVRENIVNEGGGTIGDSGWLIDKWKKRVFEIDVSKFISWWMSVCIQEVQIKIAGMDAYFVFRLNRRKYSLEFCVEEGDI
jgi:hypothetical protein